MATDEAERHSDGWLIVPFESKEAFEAWLDAHHASEPGVWIKFARKGRGIRSISMLEAVEVALCFGWIDSKMHMYDEDFFIMRHQPRRPRSPWSARNKATAARLIADGRMRPAGLAQVASAKADGRWDKAP